MRAFFLALYQLISVLKDVDQTPLAKTIRMWNDQLTLVTEGKMDLFQQPAIFFEFSTAQIIQLGNGVQLYDPFIFKIHILYWELDSQRGDFDNNLNVFDYKDQIYAAVQKFQPDLVDGQPPISACVRISEEQDYKHAGIYHFIQTYRTTFADYGAQEPVGGSETTVVPMPLEIDQTMFDVQANFVPYDATVQYLATSGTIVKTASDGKFWIIIADTPNPAGAFDATKWKFLEPNIYNYTPT